MNPLTALKWYVAVGALAIAVAGIGVYNHYQQSIGEARALAGVAGKRADSLAVELVGARRTLHVDTVRLAKRIDHWDSVTALNGVLDSARAALARAASQPKPKPDTVTLRIPATQILEADSTIRACRAIVAECGKVATMERARADAINEAFTNYKRAQPSRWMPRVGAGVAAGVNTQGKPDAVAGLTFGWTIR